MPDTGELNALRAAAAAAYEQVPYCSSSYRHSHPSQVAAIATLHGLEPPPLERCRVLELGCASGENLIPMAESLPGATFVGMDAAARQVAEAQRTLVATGIRNVRIEQRDVLDVDPAFGEFDYIVAHGVYSWVPPPVQEKLLQICKHNLAPRGIAYLSYNTYPGWKMRGIVRDLMLWAARDTADAKQRLAKALDAVDLVARSTAGDTTGYGRALHAELAQVRKKDARYLLHDHLERDNHPVYFHELMADASAVGLRYVADADARTTCSEGLPPGLQDALTRCGGDRIEREQLLDVIRNRAFRRSLLCHADLSVDPAVAPERLLDMHAASRLRATAARADAAGSDTEFRAGGVTIRTSDPAVIRALSSLADAWPRTLPVRALLATCAAAPGLQASGVAPGTAALLEELVRCSSTGALELSSEPGAATTTPGVRPRAPAHARHQARTSNVVTNLRHEPARLADLERSVLRLLDGARDIAAVVAGLVALVQDGSLRFVHGREPVADAERLTSLLHEPVRAALRRLAYSALLCA